MARAYIGVSLEDDLRLRSLRDEIYNSIGSPHHYRKKQPHITVIPPFTVEDDKKTQVASIVDDTKLVGRQVTCDNLAVWRNIASPRVVMLDVSVRMQDERIRIANELADMGVEDFPEPVRPHITLFKKYNWDAEIPNNIKENIQREIVDRTTLLDTQILDVYVEFKEEN